MLGGKDEESANKDQEDSGAKQPRRRARSLLKTTVKRKRLQQRVKKMPRLLQRMAVETIQRAMLIRQRETAKRRKRATRLRVMINLQRLRCESRRC